MRKLHHAAFWLNLNEFCALNLILSLAQICSIVPFCASNLPAPRAKIKIKFSSANRPVFCLYICNLSPFFNFDFTVSKPRKFDAGLARHEFSNLTALAQAKTVKFKAKFYFAVSCANSAIFSGVKPKYSNNAPALPLSPKLFIE